MPYLVDSNVVIDHLGEVPEASQFLDRFAQDGIVISRWREIRNEARVLQRTIGQAS